MRHGDKIVLDLDGVIAGPYAIDYMDCLPNPQVVQRIRELKEAGYTIAIHTSRNVRTHESNLGKLIASTSAIIAAWMEKHGVPYDELWVGKPWVGKGGVYVDDRAVSPQQFINLTMGELMDIVHGNAIGYQTPNSQDWVIMEVSLDDFPKALDTIAVWRQDGSRAALLFPAGTSIPLAVIEELQRAGARIFFSDKSGDPRTSIAAVAQQLFSSGEAGNLSTFAYGDSNVLSLGEAFSGEYKLAEDVHHPEPTGAFKILKSRHFNHVILVDKRIFKTSDDPIMRKKLDLELQWLQAFKGIAVSGAQPAPGGYSIDYCPVGPLSTSLLRRSTVMQITPNETADMLADLSLKLFSASVPSRSLNAEARKAAHISLLVEKSEKRLELFAQQLKDTFGADLSTTWRVNSHMIRPDAQLSALLEIIGEPLDTDYGPWHGDLCPGNIIFGPTAEGGLDLYLIDPRATDDGETLSLVGDQRYDLAKLAHALKYGYDTVLEGWYDMSATKTRFGNGLDVTINLWDEREPSIKPDRLRVWEHLCANQNVGTRGTHISSKQVSAIAALQLMTCAPLHNDDPKRALTLFSLGLQAAAEVLFGTGNYDD